MLSLILPARNWPGDRIEACVRSFLRLKSKSLTEIVVVDFGSDEPIALKVRDKRIRVVRVEAERWSLAEAINVGVIASRNPIVAKTDADIVIARESGPGLDAAVAALQRGDFGLAVVQAIDLPAGLDASRALAADTATLLSQGRLRPRWGQGGLCLFSVTIWNGIGGFESRFHGWGNEDNDFADRVRRSGRRMRWLNAEATRIFHVWHPPSYTEKDIVKARAANQQVYNGDKSTFRPVRFLHSRKSSPKPNVITTPRPLVTVAFASKARPHRERMLGEAIRGFAGQIDNDFEVLIADNGSTPEERERLKASLARLPRALAVRVIDIDKPSIPAARNRLTDEARGRYVCIADDDDIPLRTRLADHLAPFEKNAAIHGTHGGWIDFDEVTGVIDFNTGGTRTLETMLFGRGKVTAHPASFFRRDAMQAAPYDESIVAGSDLDLAVRMANMGLTVAHTDSYVTLRRFHQSNITITNLFGQVSTGVDSRQRVADTLGSVVEQQMREAGKAVRANVTCHNAISRDEIVGLIPGYSGVWRLLLPLVDLGGDDAAEGPARTAVDGGPLAIASPLNGAGLAARAAELARMVKGDVGTIDSGFDPELYFVSEPIKGAKKALAIRQLLEKTFDLEVDLIPDVEFQTRRMKRFDWSTLAARTPAGLLVSEPIKEIDNAVAALARIPGNTALRAMTSILADFNCTNPQYHIVTTAIPTADSPRAVKRVLEEQTGKSFRMVAGESPQQLGQTS